MVVRHTIYLLIVEMVWAMMLCLLSCSMSSPATLVDELRVMAIQTEPAEVSPLDQDAKLRLLIAEPQNRAVDVMYWMCTNLGNGCLEAEVYAQDIAQWPKIFARSEVLTEHDISLSPAYGGVIDALPSDAIPFYGTVLWVFACVQEECTFIEEAKEGRMDLDLMSNPFDVIASLPFGVASLAFSSIPISNRVLEERIQNPELTDISPQARIQGTEETLDLSFSYSLHAEPNEDSLIYGYTTIGGFEESTRSNAQLQQETGEIVLSWFAPQTEGTGEAYVILENGVGGTAIWYGDVEVRNP